jgi:hypothetical protein
LTLKAKKSTTRAQQGRFEIISHEGSKILILNYSACNRSDAWALTNYFQEWIARQDSKNLKILLDFEGFFLDPIHLNYVKKTLGIHDKFIKRSAIINVAPLMASMLQTLRGFANFMGVSMKKERGVIFQSKAEALDWLVGNSKLKKTKLPLKLSKNKNL